MVKCHIHYYRLLGNVLYHVRFSALPDTICLICNFCFHFYDFFWQSWWLPAVNSDYYYCCCYCCSKKVCNDQKSVLFFTWRRFSCFRNTIAFAVWLTPLPFPSPAALLTTASHRDYLQMSPNFITQIYACVYFCLWHICSPFVSFTHCTTCLRTKAPTCAYDNITLNFKMQSNTQWL